MLALISGPFTRWFLWHSQLVQWSEVWGSILAGLVAAFLVYSTTLIYYWTKRSDLDDPPRTLPYRKRKKITYHLTPYGRTTSPQVSIYPCQGVKDGKDFAENISKSLAEAGWCVSLGLEANCAPRHSKGIWILGSWTLNIPLGRPPMNVALQEALAKAGIKAQIEKEEGKEYSYLILLIGRREY